MNYRIFIIILILVTAIQPLFSQQVLAGKRLTFGPVRSTPLVRGDVFFVGSDSGSVYAIHRQKGNTLWQFKADAAVPCRMTIRENHLYFSTKAGSVYAVHVETGQETWKFSSSVSSLYPGGWDYFVSSPVPAGDRLVVGSGDGHIYALDIKDGSVKWKFNTRNPVRSTPTIDQTGGLVYCGTMDGRLLALQLKSGKLKWKLQAEGSKYFPKAEFLFKPLLHNHIIYAGSRNASFYAVDARSGKLFWKVTDKEGAWYTTAAAEGNTVYAASSDGRYLQALDAETGKEKWKFHTGDLVFSTPLVHDGLIALGSHDHFVYVLDAQTGKPIWRYRTGGDVLGSAALYGGLLYIGSDDGYVYAFRAAEIKKIGIHKRRLAVYYDPALDAQVNIDTHDSKKLMEYFRELNYEILDAAALDVFLKENIQGNPSAGSVIILASVAYPYSIFAKDANGDSLLKKYLETGGTFVSLGFPPFRYARRKGEEKLLFPGDEIMAALGIPKDFLYHAFFYYDSYISHPTAAGERINMPEWWSSGYGIDAKQVTTVLGTDEHGRATAWIKNYGGPENTGFIRLWGNHALPDNLEFVKKLIQ